MTLVTETMSSSVLPHPNSTTSVTPSTKGSSKLGFSIDSIVGAKSIVAAAAQAAQASQDKDDSSPPTTPTHGPPLGGPNGSGVPPSLSMLSEMTNHSRLRDSLTFSPTDLTLRAQGGPQGPPPPGHPLAMMANEALRNYHSSLLRDRRGSGDSSSSPSRGDRGGQGSPGANARDTSTPNSEGGEPNPAKKTPSPAGMVTIKF